MSDELKPIYDFNFICLSLNLIPIHDGESAINPSAVVSLDYDNTLNRHILKIQGSDKPYALTAYDLAQLEATIKERSEDAKILQREAMKNQMMTQYELSQEIQNGIQRAAGIIDTGKNRRRH